MRCKSLFDHTFCIRIQVNKTISVFLHLCKYTIQISNDCNKLEIPISVLSIDASIFIWISREFVVHCIWKLDLEPPWFKHLFSFSCFISPDAILHVKSQQGYRIKLAGKNVFKSLLRCSNMYVWIVVKKTVCF